MHSSTPKAGFLTAIAAFLVRIPIRIHTWTGQPWVTLTGHMRLLSRFADKLIGILNTQCYADSKSQRQFLVDEGIVAPEKIVVINHGSFSGVDLKRFDPEQWSLKDKKVIRQELSIPDDSIVIIFVGRIARDKGIAELISAFDGLLRSGYDIDLLLVGPFDQECGGISCDYAKDIGYCQRIHSVGYTEKPERYLAISDIFCLPSYREGFGTTVIEAAAMRIPAVGTNVNGLTDAIVNGETGILVPSHDDLSLLEALRQLLDNPDMVRRMGKAAKTRCTKQFDANIVNKKVAEEYMRLLNRR